jgi:hypothetical protein
MDQILQLNNTNIYIFLTLIYLQILNKKVILFFAFRISKYEIVSSWKKKTEEEKVGSKTKKKREVSSKTKKKREVSSNSIFDSIS